MGLLSSAWKSVSNGFKKVFGKVLKPFAKILNSKFFKVAMLAVSVFTMGASLLAAGSWKAAGNLILQKAAQIVTMPIDLVAKGIGAAGGVLGGTAGNALTSFAGSVQTGLGNLANAAGNVFSVPGEGMNSSLISSSSDMGDAVQEDMLGGASESLPGAKSTLDPDLLNNKSALPMAGDSMAAATPTTGYDPSQVGKTGYDMAGVTAPSSVAKPSMLAGQNPDALGSALAQGTADAASTVASSGEGGYFSKLSGFVKDNKEILKFGADAVAAYNKEDPAVTLARAKELDWNNRNAAFQPYAQSGFGGQVPGDYGQLQQRNQGLMTAARDTASQYGSTNAQYGKSYA